MEYTLAMQIVGVVMLLTGIKMNVDPKGFNRDIFGDFVGIDSGEASAMRMAIGGGPIGMATLLLYASVNLDSGDAGATILVGAGLGLAAFFITIISAKFRGFVDNIPTLPMVLLPLLIILCFYVGLT
ncbi:MAG: hypothetical protein CXT72_04260 [Methanobacteriota archaeon]|jgi:hypothetical protein|nr:MAG: hypothetical protein CXT72_04260 [Euryarchaeota archaeon]HIE63135.1 hypothetical protein [Candidatus Poseidoniales archaeon]HIK99722.1 hypothetical protein [Candidatus Poseidoniales archaeon]